MGYFLWESPPRCFRFASETFSEDHCPDFPSASARGDELSPLYPCLCIGVVHKSLELDHLIYILLSDPDDRLRNHH